jgi:hypothetical protein
MAQQAGYWVEIKGIKLDEGTRRSWIQVVPLGTYNHPEYGKLEFTSERLATFAQNFKNNVRTTQLDVDYDHKDVDGKAAGWYQDVEVRDDGLWAEIEWTPNAFASLQAGEYRYFSPEFSDEWVHPQTGETHKDVLFGGALTNRPFLRDILPINLSEVIQANEGDNLMDPKELRKLLGLPEDASDDDTNSALTAALQKIEAAANGGEGDEGNGGGDEGGQGEPTPPQEQPEPATQQAPAMASELKKLAEDNPAIAKLLEEKEAQNKRLATLEAAHRLSEVTVKLKEMQEGGKFAIPPNVQEKIKGLAASAPRNLSDQMLGIVKELTEAGLIPLNEVGSTSGTEANSQPSKRFSDLVDKAMSDGKTDYVTAVEQVGAQHPQLWEQYRRESFLTEESS